MTHAGDVEIGAVIADKYRVERIIGRGGMGVVVAVWHEDLRERRAIKFMLPKAAQHAEAVERFLREARAAARLKSSHAVKIHDVARMPSGVPYIVMEYLEGMDLENLLKSRGPLNIDEASRYVLQACDAIGEAHSLGVVHRDLKPANLFITTGVRGDPSIKVLDFGIAKVARDADEESPSLTVAHKTMGTPAYMSPEHVNDSKTVDGRADIWSLGVILYHLTTRSLPFIANHHPLLYAKILDDRAIAPPPSRINSTIPPQFDAVVLRCLQKNIQSRYQSISELVNALTPFATGEITQIHSSARNQAIGPMGTILLNQDAPTPPRTSSDHFTMPTIPTGPPTATVEQTLPGGMVKAAPQTISMRKAIVASAVAGSLITGIAAWTIVSNRRHAPGPETGPSPAMQDKPMVFQDKSTAEAPAPVMSATSETTPAASISSAPAPPLPASQAAPKPTGQKKLSTSIKNQNKEFSTRK